MQRNSAAMQDLGIVAEDLGVVVQDLGIVLAPQRVLSYRAVRRLT